MTDLFQKTDVSFGSAIALLALGVAILVLPRSFVVDRVWKGWLNQEMHSEYGKRAFGVSCVLLAGLLYGFSTLSAKAADEGGLIASQIPEIREMQIALGVVQQQITKVHAVTTEIKNDTGRLLEASNRWLEFSLMLNIQYGQDTKGNMVRRAIAATPVVRNDTNLQFENIQVNLSSPAEGLDYTQTVPLLPGQQYRADDDALKVTPQTVEACISAKRRGSDEWLVERQSMNFTLENNHAYEKTDSSGALVFTTPVSCGDA